MNTHRTAAPGRRPLDRRTVVRVGAWSVPVVSLAAAAPALAASTTTGTLKFDTFNVFGADYNGAGKATTLQSQIQVQNVFVAGGPTVSTLTVLVTYPGSRVDGSAPTHVSGSGWTFASATPSGSSWVYSFVWTGTLATSHSTSTLTYRVPLSVLSKGKVEISGIATAAGMDNATASASTSLN